MKRLAVLALFGAGCTNFALLAELKPRKVTVRLTDKIVQPDGGTALVPRPKAGLAPCVAAVDVAVTQQWQTIEGTWTADGECTLRDVPPGETLITGIPGLAGGHVTIPGDTVDFGLDFTGRPFAFAAKGTTVTVDLSGASPLQEQNIVSMYMPDFGAGLVDVNGGTNAKIGVPMGMVGATSFPITFDLEDQPLIRPDEAIEVYQGLPILPGTPSYLLGKRGTVKVAVVDGRNVRVTAPMADLPSRAPGFAAFSFSPASFYAALESDLVAPVRLAGLVLQEAVLENATLPLSVQGTFQLDGGQITAAATQADPFPGRTWSRRIEVGAGWRSIVSTKQNNKGSVVLVAGFHGPADDLAWLNSGWMTPVRDIRAVRRDGRKIETGAIDSASPTLVWDAPATGLANQYSVIVYEMTSDPANATLLVFTRYPEVVYTDRNEAHIPPGILKLDTNYVFVVTATNCVATDPRRPLSLTLQQTCASSDQRSLVMFTPKN